MNLYKVRCTHIYLSIQPKRTELNRVKQNPTHHGCLYCWFFFILFSYLDSLVCTFIIYFSVGCLHSLHSFIIPAACVYFSLHRTIMVFNTFQTVHLNLRFALDYVMAVTHFRQCLTHNTNLIQEQYSFYKQSIFI